MYLSFFGFQRPPFELVPDPDFLFLGQSHDSAMANVAMGLESGKGFVVIIGPVGTGKTTILRAMLRRIGRDQNVCFLSQPESNVDDLLRAVLDGFHVAPEGPDLIDLRRTLRCLLESSDRPGILIVDEAHLLSEEALEQLRLLSNLEEESRKLLQIVLSGQPELKELLSRPRLRPLAQRIEMFYEIEPLGEAETHEYVLRRLRIAGNPDGLEFEPRAMARIHFVTGGVPRLINVLVDRALIAAYVEETTRITDTLVLEAYDDLGEVTQSVMPGVPAGRRRPALVAAGSYPPPPPLPPAEGEARGRAEARAAAKPRPHPGSRRARGSRRLDRWLAGAGIVSVVLLAVFSLGTDGIGVLPGALAEGGFPSSSGEAREEIPARAATPTTPDGPVERAPEPAVPGPATEPPGAPEGPLAIQVASFRQLDRARKFAAELRSEAGYPTRISPTEVETGLWYRVLVGECETHDEARDLMNDLRRKRDFSFLRAVRLIAAADRRTATADSN